MLPVKKVPPRQPLARVRRLKAGRGEGDELPLEADARTGIFVADPRAAELSERSRGGGVVGHAKVRQGPLELQKARALSQ